MKRLIKLFLVTVFVFLQSCDSAKKVANTERSKLEDAKVMNEKLINDGYSFGTIKYTDNGDCSYVIVDEKSKAKLDPMNMGVKKYDAFKNKSMRIYFKYRNLRRSNRCGDARPIELVDMQKA